MLQVYEDAEAGLRGIHLRPKKNRLWESDHETEGRAEMGDRS